MPRRAARRRPSRSAAFRRLSGSSGTRRLSRHARAAAGAARARRRPLARALPPGVREAPPRTAQVARGRAAAACQVSAPHHTHLAHTPLQRLQVKRVARARRSGRAGAALPARQQPHPRPPSPGRSPHQLIRSRGGRGFPGERRLRPPHTPGPPPRPDAASSTRRLCPTRARCRPR